MKDFYEMQYEKNGDKVINYFKSIYALECELRSLRYSKEYIKYVEEELLRIFEEKHRKNTIHYEDRNIKVKLLGSIPGECTNTIKQLKQQTDLDINYYDIVDYRDTLNRFTYKIRIFDECTITYNKCIGYRCIIKLNNEEYTTHSINNECFIKYVVALINRLSKIRLTDADIQRRAGKYIEEHYIKHYRLQGKHLIYNITYKIIDRNKVNLQTIQYNVNLVTSLTETKTLKKADKQGLENRYIPGMNN